MQRIRIFVLSAGDPTGINFCRSLGLVPGKYHIIGSDTNVYRLALATADERVLLPDPQSENYLSSLIAAVGRSGAHIVYASDTNAELAILSDNRERIPATIFLPARDAIALYEDKWLSYQCFEASGLPVPETRRLQEPRDVEECVSAFGSVWLRATHGSGGRGSLATDDAELAKAWIRRHDGWGQFTAARVLTRRMATWSAVWWHGQLVVAQGRHRLHWEYGNLSPSGVTGITGAQSTTDDAIITETAMAAIASTRHVPHGIVSVDLTYDDRGRPNPTEIQGSRFYSSIHFLAAAGLNFPDIYVSLALSGALPTFETRINPLPSGLLWLKGVDCLPQMTTCEAIDQLRAQWSTDVPPGRP